MKSTRSNPVIMPKSQQSEHTCTVFPLWQGGEYLRSETTSQGCACLLPCFSDNREEKRLFSRLFFARQSSD